MTRQELHALVDIVMDARDRMPVKRLWITIDTDVSFYDMDGRIFRSNLFDTFSDFTQAVKEYIKTLKG
jgi:hypothetical protein